MKVIFILILLCLFSEPAFSQSHPNQRFQIIDVETIGPYMLDTATGQTWTPVVYTHKESGKKISFWSPIITFKDPTEQTNFLSNWITAIEGKNSAAVPDGFVLDP